MFWRKSATEVTEGVDLSGKVAVVTGASSGIGEETARVLALRGATVVLAVRNTEAGEQSKARIQEELKAAKASSDSESPAEDRLMVLPLDLASKDSVKSFASKFNDLNLPLNVLINNAGVMMCPFMRTKDGHELQFGTNHLGPFLLTNLLLPKLKATAAESGSESRVVNVSSLMHRFSYPEGIRFGRIDEEAGYDKNKAYGQSKLAGILHARELAKRLQEEKADVTVNALHPGVIATHLTRHMMEQGSLSYKVYSMLTRSFCHTVPQGAATSCYVATSPSMKGVSGKYFSDCQETKPSAQAENDDLAKKLWEESEALVS